MAGGAGLRLLLCAEPGRGSSRVSSRSREGACTAEGHLPPACGSVSRGATHKPASEYICKVQPPKKCSFPPLFCFKFSANINYPEDLNAT